MIEAIMEYFDQLMAIVRPLGVLYIAFDGVAPRAKMTSQRFHRYLAEKESREQAIELDKRRAELLEKGILYWFYE